MAEDDLLVAAALQAILAEAGFTVVAASHGVEALSAFEREPFDLLLTDIVMPEMDGFTLFDEVRARKPDLPVVVMTGYTFSSDKDSLARLSAAGAVVVHKPIGADPLVNVVRDALARSTGRGISGAEQAPLNRELPPRRAGPLYAVVFASEGGHSFALGGLRVDEVLEAIHTVRNETDAREFRSPRVFLLPGMVDVTNMFRSLL